MTKLISTLCATILLIVVAGCSDSSTNSDGSGLTMGTMKSKVDGKSWQSGNAMAVKAGDNAVTISGANYSVQTQQTETISFVITGTIVEGSSNNISMAQFSVGNTADPMATVLYNSTTPSINITKVNDAEISGTFSFTGKNDENESKVITEGEFRVKFVN